MFGYIRPLKGELKLREFEKFRACYCGLCSALGKEYGITSRLILNYDFVFLAALMWDEEEKFKTEKIRCPLCPLRKKCAVNRSSSLDDAAGYSIILTYWKLSDSLADERFFKKALSYSMRLFLTGAYKKAAARFEDFDILCREQLSQLSELEKNGAHSIDIPADKFANIMRGLACGADNEKKRRVLEQMLYHMGRWIYITDAINDFHDDMLLGRYNPVADRFDIKDSSKIPDDELELLISTLSQSQHLISSAYELLPKTTWSEITENIIYLGMPAVLESVKNGTFGNGRRARRKRSEINNERSL